MRIHFADFLFYICNVLKPRYIPPFPQRVETRVTSTHFHNGLKPIAHKSVMATPFVRGMTFTSRVATADINSLKFQRRAEIPKSVMAKPFVRGYGEGGNPAYPNCFSIPLFKGGGVRIIMFTANHSLRCNHQKLPRSLSRKAGGELRGPFYH